MFHAISWTAYWTVIGILSLGYYLGVYLLYFRRDFGIQLPRKGKEVFVNLDRDTAGNLSDDDKIVDDYENCRQEIESFLEQGNLEGKGKGEMIDVVKRIVQKYPALQSIKYRSELNSFIVTAFSSYCRIHLDEEEMAMVW